MDWVIPFLGRKWVNQEQDCWKLIQDVYKERLNIILPDICINADDLKTVLNAFKNEDYLKIWEPIDEPENLCLVFFSTHKNPSHVAVYLDVEDGRYLHSYQGAGSVCQTIVDAEINGWNRPKFYRYRGHD
ncbi:C40 family peptidase [Shewanella sp. KX20019]|uniref:NlpC/P60 family protein n=1 Tax=Shewanella sp. KX20019 TaxID=2803864 RepID=UPI001925DF28|nr:NlpC/P60 family protein [Shewanella sp. KX20019]QQX80869.1 C40 family peptidase [Shewanella sp. KX20019]